MASSKYRTVRKVLGALFLIVSGRTIIDNLIRKPIAWILTALGQWCDTAPILEGERPVMVLRWADGNCYVHRVALKGSTIRVLDTYDPMHTLNDFCDRYPDDELKSMLASAITGETPDGGDDDAPKFDFDSLMKSSPEQ